MGSSVNNNSFFRSSYILKQESLPPSYKSFLNKHGGKAGVILQGMKEIANGKPFSNLEVIEKYYKTVGIEIELDPQMKVPCTVCILERFVLPCGSSIQFSEHEYTFSFRFLFVSLYVKDVLKLHACFYCTKNA